MRIFSSAGPIASEMYPFIPKIASINDINALLLKMNPGKEVFSG